MKKNILLLIFTLSVVIAPAQIIPAGRSIDWSATGYPDSIPEPSTILDVMNYGAIADGIADDYAAVISAISALGGNRGVVYFPPGEYKIGSSLTLPDSVILRGASSDSTHLKFDLQGAIGNCINITGSVIGVFDTIIGAFQGNNFITVLDEQPYQPGMYLELLEDNGSWDTQPISWADNSVGQIVYLTDVTPSGVGGRLEIQTTIRGEYNVNWGSNARIRIINPAREVGVECLRLSRADSVHAGVCFNIYYNYAVNCWIRGVESSKSIGSHVEADASSRLTITGSYFHDAYEYDGVSTHGYGITLFNHTGECRLENNIMKHLRHSFSMQAGANGNVIAYNYSLDPNRSESPADFGADISMHGHFPFFNLFEGNIVQNIQLDQTWGPSGPYNTFFRNRAELYGILMTSGTVESNEQHFVGNEVPNTTIFLGNYITAGTGHIEYGNMVRGTLTPTGTTPLNDSSYYLTSKPSFWGTSNSWPSIGIPNPSGSGTIPAKARYLAGGSMTVCREEIITNLQTLSSDENLFSVAPNPFSHEISIFLSGSGSKSSIVRIHEITGRMIFEKTTNLNHGKNRFEPLDNLSEGIYILSIQNNNDIQVLKIIKQKPN